MAPYDYDMPVVYGMVTPWQCCGYIISYALLCYDYAYIYTMTQLYENGYGMTILWL